MSGRKKHEVCSGDPRLVDAVKMRLIQTIKGSQYLHSRPGTPEKNNLEPVIATRKTDFVGFDPAAAIYLHKMSDLELLQQHAGKGSEESFAALLDRHLGLVYSAALRQVRSPELAEEVAQSVFTDLARNARNLEPQTVLAAYKPANNARSRPIYRSFSLT